MRTLLLCAALLFAVPAYAQEANTSPHSSAEALWRWDILKPPPGEDGMNISIVKANSDTITSDQLELIKARFWGVIRACQSKSTWDEFLTCVETGLTDAYDKGLFGPDIMLMTMRVKASE